MRKNIEPNKRLRNLFTVIQLIGSGVSTPKEMLKKVDVNERTIYRYINILESSGIIKRSGLAHCQQSYSIKFIGPCPCCGGQLNHAN